MKKRILIVILILAVLNACAAFRVIRGLPLVQEHMGAALLSSVAFFVLQLAGPFGDRLWFPQLKKKFRVETLVFVIDWLSYSAFGLMSLMVAFGLATDIGALLWKSIALTSDTATVDRWSFNIFAALTIGTFVIGVWRAQAGPWVKRVDVPIRNLPPAFESYTIAQVSDLHVGPTIKLNYTRKVTDIVNGLKPDMIALTGDFIDGTVADLSPHLAPLKDLRAKDGVFFVTGNHEYYWNAYAWSAEFKRLGARVLANEHEVIKRGSDAIVVAGVNDLSAAGEGPEASDAQKSIAAAPAGLPKILLAHQPGSYKQAAAAGFDLQLSGHAHAGQYFPFTLLIRFFQRYYKGLNRHENLWVYVNNGTGYWGPPLRAGAPAEVTLLTLKRA